MHRPEGGSDPFVALASELGRIGQRLDGIGAELLALRAERDTAAPSPGEARPPGPAAAGPVPAPWVAAPGPTGPPGGPEAHPAGPWGRPGVSAGAPAGPPGLPAPAGGGWAPPGGPGGPTGGTRGAPAVPAALPAGSGALPGGPAVPWGAPPGGPWAQSGVVAGPPPWGPGVPPAPPRRRTPIDGARLMAWAGGGVTLVGVVLLLVLAASRGWLTPPLRLTAGALLGAGLVGLGLWLHRRETARTGALALAATGFVALFLTDAAATALYDYLPAPVALLLALAVAGAGLGVADRWRSSLLACGVTVAAALLAPALADGWLLVTLVLALQVAALPVVVRRTWTVLLALAAAAPALYGTAVVVLDETRPGVAAGVAAAVLAVGLAGVVIARKTASGVRAAAVAAAALPACAAPAAVADVTATLVVLGAAAVLGALAFLPRTDRAVRVAAGVTALVALLEATVDGLDGAWVTVAVLGQALVGAGVAIVLRSRFAAVAGLALGVIGLLLAVGRDAPLRALLRAGGAPYLLDGVPQIAGIVTGVAASLLLLALATAMLVATGRLGWTRPDAASAAIWVPLGLAGLYGAASLVMALAVLVAPGQAGFTAGHAVITVSWTVAALVLLARGLRRPALRIAGLVLVAAALAKLVLFDLLALDGLARALAFLVAGLVLLAAGTRYARMVAEAHRPEPAAEPAPTAGPPNG